MEDFESLLEIVRLLDAGDTEGALDLLSEVIRKNVPADWKPEVPFPDPIYGAGYAHASGYHNQPLDNEPDLEQDENAVRCGLVNRAP